MMTDMDNLSITSVKRYETENDTKFSRISLNFNDELIKLLYFSALRIDGTDASINNNMKADIVKGILAPLGFSEVGTGTNRIAFAKNNYIFKIALDVDGFEDNYTEYKRSSEAPEYLAKTYETNSLILVAEYVNLMDKEDFLAQRDQISIILEELGKMYIFGDLGLTSKNFCNFGYRSNGTIVALDFAYMHPRIGNEEALMCPACGNLLGYSNTFTQFKCSHNACNVKMDYIEVKRRMRMNYEEIEDQFISELNSLELPDISVLHEDASHITLSSNTSNNDEDDYDDDEEAIIRVNDSIDDSENGDED